MSHKFTVERKALVHIEMFYLPLPSFSIEILLREEKGSFRGIVLIVITRYLYQLPYTLTSFQIMKSGISEIIE